MSVRRSSTHNYSIDLFLLEILLLTTRHTISSEKLKRCSDWITGGRCIVPSRAHSRWSTNRVGELIYCDISSRRFLFDAGLAGQQTLSICWRRAPNNRQRRSTARNRGSTPLPATSVPAGATQHELFDALVDLISSAVDYIAGCKTVGWKLPVIRRSTARQDTPAAAPPETNWMLSPLLLLLLLLTRLRWGDWHRCFLR